MHFQTMKLCSISVVTAATISAAIAGDEWVSFSESGEAIVANIDSIQEFRGGSSAVYELDGKVHRAGTKGYKRLGPVVRSTGTTPFGEARVSTMTYGAADAPFEFTLTLKQLTSLKAFTLQGVIHNRGDKDVKLHAFDLFDMRGAGGKLTVENPSKWLVTPLMKDLAAASLADTENNLGEAAIIYRNDTDGFLVGPVGPAEAHTSVEVREGTVKAVVQMDRVLVRAGESRRSEEMIFCFEPVKTATDIWTRWVAATHGVRRHQGPVYGWCSWYDRTTKIDAAHVLDVTKTIAENPDTFGKGIIQIDDGYQKMDGDWRANDKFPMGMAAVAKTIREAGCTPGVWFAPLMINPDHPWIEENPDAIQKNAKGIASFMNANPFHPAGAKWLNPDHPASKEFLFNIIRDARERGYGYIKIDFNGIGSRFLDPTKTRLQIFRELYTLYREAAGEEMYILSCLGQPTRGVVGFVDAARVGPDSHPAHFDKCLNSVLRFQIFDNVWWQNDPDVSYLDEKLESRVVGYTPQGLEMWKTWHNINTLVGGTAMISEPINKPDVKEVWRNYEIMRPGSREPARLLTLGRSAENTTFGFAASRPYGDFAVYNLYNPGEETKHINLVFDRAGLPAEGKVAVFDFWKNEVIAYTEGSYNTAPLEQHASALLRFTPLKDEGPTLVGSNLHLSIGATEIDNIRSGGNHLKIGLSDAGAREGSLTFHSTRPLKADVSENCTLASVESVGEDLWRIHLKDRKWNTDQSFRLVVEETPSAQSANR